MHGAMGWIEARTKIMILSEPIYYFGTLLAQKEENNYSTFADMKGRKVGTVTGFTLVPELKSGRRHRRSEALRHLRRRDAGSAGRPHRHGDPRSAARAVRDLPASGMEAEAGPAHAGAGQVSGHVDEVQRDLRHQQGRARAGRSHQWRDQAGLGGLPEREGHGQVRPGRQGLVRPAGEEPAHRRRPAEQTTRRRPPIIASELPMSHDRGGTGRPAAAIHQARLLAAQRLASHGGMGNEPAGERRPASAD